MRRRAIAQAFGRVLRELREQRNLSQEALALDAGLDRTYTSLLERGLRTPALAVILDIAQVLKVEPETLVQGTRKALGSTA